MIADLINHLRRRSRPAGLLLAAVLLTIQLFAQPALGSPLLPADGGPIVTGVSPSVGPMAGGSSVVITGSGFTDATEVDFGSTSASFTVNSDTSITATSPAGTLGTVDVTVTSLEGGPSATSNADQFTYDPPPTVTNVSPSVGPVAGGTQVTITGTGFTDATAVNFGSTGASFAVNSDGSITATSPAGTLGTVDVIVTTSDGGPSAASNADQFTYDPPPTVTNVSPSVGPEAGGTSVVITGSGFTDATEVDFGSTNASFAVNSDTSITATSPAGSLGTVDVIVTTSDGGPSATSNADQFTYDPPPTVTGINPAVGPLAAGTQVTIAGTGFTDATAVNFGSTSASFAVNSDSSITATSPAGSSGTVDVIVTTSNGGPSATSNADQFTYDPVPTVTGIGTNAGPLAGGTSVTITGTGFSGVTAVKFGSTTASFTFNSPTSITTTSPAGSSGTVDVTVTTPGGQSATSAGDKFTYYPLPTVTGIGTSAGPVAGGTSVTITGSGFTGASAVKFGSTTASFTFNSATSITATSPAGTSGTVDVTVTTPGGQSATSAADQFSYDPVPAISGITPNAGPLAGGTSVTIAGSGFTGATAVDFGSKPAQPFTVESSTQIDAKTPASIGPGLVDVTVTTPGGTSQTGSSADEFTYVSAPAITQVKPSVGPVAGRTQVTITGTGFIGETAVDFGSTAATAVTVNSDSSITATSPAGSAGSVDVTVTTQNGGQSATSPADQFTYYAVPAVTGISPNAGPLAGGTSVTITGTGLAGATAVRFGSTAASFNVNSASSITATSPAGSSGAVDITVTTPGGQSPTSTADQFAYDPVPTVTSIGTSAGPLAGGTSVTITGTGFTGTSTVKFGSTAATGVTVNSDSSITATSPAESSGTVDVIVTTPGGQSATSGADRFTYYPLPIVTGIGTNAGPLAGGTSVTITGTGFSGVTAVKFGSTTASFTFNSGTSITATSPAESSGTVDVTVTTPGGQSATSTGDQFSYDPVPAISGITPGAGPLAGGTPVTITGTGLTGASVVDFGSTAATSFNVVSDTEITTTSPAEAGGVTTLTVTTPGGTSSSVGLSDDEFTYTPGPTVTSVTPSAGPLGGTAVTITGTGFTAQTTLAFGSTQVSPTVVSATEITATAPAGSGTVNVTVTTSGGTSPTTGTGDQFTYDPVPTISGISPGAGLLAGGTPVTITGTGFTGATSVDFGSTPAESFTVESDTQINAKTPVSTAVGAVSVTVTTPGGTSTTTADDQFTYEPVPTVTAISPSSGPTIGGTSVTIRGAGFTAGTAVKFGSVAAQSSTLESATQITATSPPESAATIDVTVTTPGGTSSRGAPDRFTYVLLLTPQIRGISPVGGALGGGTQVTITGSNLGAATGVLFGSKPAASFVVSSDTQIVAVSPQGASGPVDVTVTAPAGTSTPASAFTFTYAPAPQLAFADVSSRASKSATINGLVDSYGLPITGCEFQYGTTSRYGHTAVCVHAASSTQSATVAVSAALQHLAPVTKYHYRLIATTAAGTSTGSDETFNTSQLPVVGAPLIGLLVEQVSRPGSIGKLLGIHGISGAVLGESILVHCVAACSRKLALKLPLLNSHNMHRKITLPHPLLLSAATRIEIDISASNEMSRYARYAFASQGRNIAVRITASGCLSTAGKRMRCPSVHR